MSRIKRPATRIDLGEQGRIAVRTSLEDFMREQDMELSDLRLRYLGATGDQAALFRLQQGLALIHFKEYDKALEILRDARMTTVQGVSQGTLDYYTGVCLLHMGNVYLSETLQSFNQALKYPQATLFGPDGPLLAPLARQSLEDLKP